MFCLWNWFVSNQDHVWSALSAIGAVGTLFIAYRALRAWRDEKQYGLAIENLALSNSAIQFIAVLRSPVTYEDEIVNEEYKKKLSEIETEDESKLAKRAAKAMFIYQSRKDKQKDLYEQLLKLREKNWAAHGPDHEFYKFYDHVIELDNAIWSAHVTHYYTTKDHDDLTDEQFKAIVKEARSTIYNLTQDDSIMQELNEWRTELQKYRKPNNYN